MNLSLRNLGVVTAAGGPSLPSSITHYFAPSDMVFNGSNELTAINDRVAANNDHITIVGAPIGNTTEGMERDQSTTTLTNYLAVGDAIFARAAIDAAHVAMLYKRDVTGQAILLPFGNTANNAFFIAQTFSSSPANDDFNLSEVTDGTTTFTDPITRLQLHSLLPEDQWSVLVVKDVWVTEPNPMRLGSWLQPTYNMDGRIAGLARFTNAADTADVITQLLAEVGA